MYGKTKCNWMKLLKHKLFEKCHCSSQYFECIFHLPHSGSFSKSNNLGTSALNPLKVHSLTLKHGLHRIKHSGDCFWASIPVFPVTITHINKAKFIFNSTAWLITTALLVTEALRRGPVKQLPSGCLVLAAFPICFTCLFFWIIYFTISLSRAPGLGLTLSPKLFRAENSLVYTQIM